MAPSLENKKFKNKGVNRYQASQYLQAVRVIDIILDDQGTPWESKTKPKHNFL